MKLRIHDNSLRLRLTMKEVTRLAEQGSVESAIQFFRRPTVALLRVGFDRR